MEFQLEEDFGEPSVEPQLELPEIGDKCTSLVDVFVNNEESEVQTITKVIESLYRNLQMIVKVMSSWELRKEARKKQCL